MLPQRRRELMDNSSPQRVPPTAQRAIQPGERLIRHLSRYAEREGEGFTAGLAATKDLR